MKLLPRILGLIILCAIVFTIGYFQVGMACH